MALRTNASDVLTILENGSDFSESDVTPFLITANLLVSGQLSGEGLSTSIMTEIEKYLSAHLMTTAIDRQTIRTEIGGDTSDQYPHLGKGLNSSTYGQTVKLLDTTGKLANLGKKKAKIKAVTSFKTY